ncbi:hypothetical protein Tco_0720496 [Tanacetum coccineum]
MEILQVSTLNSTVDPSWKSYQGGSSKLNLPDHKSALMEPEYEHVGQDSRSQDGKDDKDLKDKDLKILKLKSKSKEKAQDQRSQSMKEQANNNDKDQFQDSRNQCQRNLKKPKVEGFKDLDSGEIVSLKILSRTRKLGHSSRKLQSLFKYML